MVSPALGGVIIGHEVARALGTRFLFTERDPATGKMLLRRGFTVAPGEIAVVVEDVITTGGSTQDVIEDAAGARGHAWSRRVRSSTAAADAPMWACRAWRWRRCRWPRITRRSARCAAGHSGGQARLPPGLMRRIKITLAYDGGRFHGWQVQPGLPTIQGFSKRS